MFDGGKLEQEGSSQKQRLRCQCCHLPKGMSQDSPWILVSVPLFDGGRFELEGPKSEAPVEGVEDPVAMAVFVRFHPSTSAEIRALCNDLQVLGRSEFKQLLKWCASFPCLHALLHPCSFACSSLEGGQMSGPSREHSRD